MVEIVDFVKLSSLARLPGRSFMSLYFDVQAIQDDYCCTPAVAHQPVNLHCSDRISLRPDLFFFCFIKNLIHNHLQMHQLSL